MLHCICTVFTAPHNNRQVTPYIYCIYCTTQQQTSYTVYLLYSLNHTTTDKLHSIFTLFTAPHNKRQAKLYIYCINYTTQQHTIYTLYLLYSLHHKITLNCTAVLVESFKFLLCDQRVWRSDVKCLAKQRMCCLCKPDNASYMMVIYEGKIVNAVSNCSQNLLCNTIKLLEQPLLVYIIFNGVDGMWHLFVF